MKRLSALFIGIIMIVGAQTAFGLVGYEDPSVTSGIAATQPWGHDRAEGTNCMNVLTGSDSEGASADGFKIEQVCLRDEGDADKRSDYDNGNGGF